MLCREPTEYPEPYKGITMCPVCMGPRPSEVENLREAGGRRQEAGGRRQEAGGRRQEAGGRRQEAQRTACSG
ncbi:hypothetical protein GCM10027073_31680 [Streptomyces chlorus]